MMQIGPGKMSASVAMAAWVQRAGIVAIAGIAYLDVPVAGKQPAISRIAGRHDAVEHVDSAADPLDEIFRRTYAHTLAWRLLRQEGGYVVQHPHEVFFRRTPRQ